jgi:hypothetical protein
MVRNKAKSRLKSSSDTVTHDAAASSGNGKIPFGKRRRLRVVGLFSPTSRKVAN